MDVYKIKSSSVIALWIYVLSIRSGKVSPAILDMLGEEETMIQVGRERKIIAEALRARLG